MHQTHKSYPVKNDVDYFPMYNNEGVAINLAKYENDQVKFIAGGVSYGSLYTINGGKRSIIVVDPVDGILCWYKTKATIYVAFTKENLRYTVKAYKEHISPVICDRDQAFIDEFKDDFEVRLLTGDSYGKKGTEKEFKINVAS